MTEQPTTGTSQAAAAAAESQTAVIDRPAPGAVIVAEAAHAAQLRMTFASGVARIAVMDVDLVMIFADGGKIILPGLAMRVLSPNAPRLSFADGDVSPQSFFARVDDVQLSDQLPQLALSRSLTQDQQQGPPQPPQAPGNGIPVVQLPSLPPGSLTPAPIRSRATQSSDDSGQLDLTTGRFIRRSNQLETEQQNSSGSSSGGTPPATTETPQPKPEVPNQLPRVTSDGGGASAAIALKENGQGVTVVSGTDPDSKELHYAIVGGADARRFAINSGTGHLYFTENANFEDPTDADATYAVTVAAIDARGGEARQSLTVTVQDVNEAPVLNEPVPLSVSENAAAGTLVARVRAIDPDRNDRVTYSFANEGDASGRFLINSVTGEVTLKDVDLLDYEDEYVHWLSVIATDRAGLTAETEVLIEVLDANDRPVIVSDGGDDTAQIVLTENRVSVTNVTATDNDVGDTITYSIVGGADAGRFSIDAATGALTFRASPDAENPTDVDADGNYEVEVQASDGSSFDRQLISITIEDENEAPTDAMLTGSIVDETAVAGTAVGVVTGVDPDVGDTLTYGFAQGGDAGGRFSIDAVTGAITVAAGASFNFETSPFHLIVVTVADSGGLTLSKPFVIEVRDQNDPPVITSDGGGSAALITLTEGDTFVTTTTAADPDAGTQLVYSIQGGPDAARFQINAGTGVLQFIAPPDYENPQDADADNSYQIVVQVSDGRLTDSQTLTIVVSDRNEPPVIVSDGGGPIASLLFQENQTAVTTVNAIDPDQGTSLVYLIAGGADAALFQINPVNGQLTFNSAPDLETPADANGDGIYEVEILVSDGQLADTQLIRITITNQNEAPSIVSDGGGDTAARSISEGQTFVGTVAGQDPDAGTTLIYSVAGGQDAAKFVIDPLTGALSFAAAPNFEAPGSLAGTNTYDVVVRVTDGQFSDDQTLTITVNDAADAPQITSNGGGATASVIRVENGSAVTTVTAADEDPTDVLSYRITGGLDAALFTIDVASGALAFINNPNFEAPADSDLNNIYQVIVEVSDGALTDTQTLNIQVTNQNEAPSITSLGGGATATFNRSENLVNIGTMTATDPDAAATRTWSIAGGADAARFQIDASSGLLRFIVAPNFEAPIDTGANNVYDVVVQVSDGTLTDSQSIAVTVTNVNEAPAAINLTGGTVAENTANGSAVGSVAGVDPDAGAVLTYAFTAGGNAGGRFAIAANGQITVANSSLLDFETGSSHVVTVRATDQGGLFIDRALTITLTNVNEAPVITSGGAGPIAALGIPENQTAVITMTASDQDAATTLVWSIIGGADAARFQIDALTGQLRFVTAPDRENPTDANLDNIYDVVVQVSDGTVTDTQSIAVSVNDTNEAPSDMVLAGGSIAENAANGTVVGNVTGTDPDPGDALTYSFVPGGDAGGRFAIAANGQITVADSGLLNFEAGASHSVTVRATDLGGLTFDKTFSITLTDLNEVPVISSNGGAASTSLSVAENAAAVMTFAASDPDSGTTLTWSLAGGADAARFVIDPVTGALSFAPAPNFEAATDAGGNNVYDVIVRVSDGLLSDTQTLAITVNNLNEAPTGATLGSSVVAENAANGTVIGSVTGVDPDAGAVLTYSFAPGGDAGGRFAIAANGQITVANGSLLNLEAAASHGITVRITDQGGLFTDQAFSITVSNVNEAPVISSNGSAVSASLSVNENTASVMTFAASDPDLGATLTWSIAGGADAARFVIDPVTGSLSFATAPNFEAATDVGNNNVYDVVVRVSDGLLSDTQALAITVVDRREAPTGGTLANPNVAENAANGTVVGSVAGTDPDIGDTLSYSFMPGGNAGGRFAIAANGQITVANGSLLDHEAATSHAITVRISDQGGLFVDQALTVNVTNSNEAPVLTSFGGLDIQTQATENTTFVANIAATDPDAGATITYSIVSGGDSAHFVIDPVTGVLSFAAPQNFEAPPADVDGDRIYDVTVRASDGTLSDTQSLAVVLIDDNEAPVLAGGPTLSVSVTESSTAVATIKASDPESAAIIYSITGGVDQALFDINPTTGALTFRTSPNFEMPADSNGDNVYAVTVSASDGLNQVAQAVTVTVTDINEAPSAPAILSAPQRVDYVVNGSFERFSGAPADVGHYNAPSLAGWSFTQGTVAELIKTPTHGNVALDMEQSPGNIGISQTITGLAASELYTLTFDIANPGAQPNGLQVLFGGVVVGSFSLAAFSASSPQSVGLIGGSGNGSNLLEIRETGLIIDGNGTTLDNLRLIRSTVIEPAVMENAANGATVFAANSFDPEGGLTWSLTNDAGGRFSIDPVTGVVSVANGTLLDYETATFHDIVVRATDGGGLAASSTIRITVANDLPVMLGTNVGETLLAQTEGSHLIGLDGNDTLRSSSGNDLLDGGSGTDYASYDNASAPVTVDLALTGPQNTGGGGTDELIGIEYLQGGTGGDTLFGNSGDNVLLGGQGNDTLDARDGNDWVEGGDGDDTLVGGSGTDTVSYANASSGVQVDISSTAVQDTFGAGQDRISGFGQLYGSAFADTLTGTTQSDSIWGNTGNDTINGGLGDDTLSGDDGDDWIATGGGRDSVSGGNGNDRIFVDTVAVRDAVTDLKGGTGNDEVSISGAGALTLAQLVGAISEVETIDLRNAGVAADATGFTASAARSLLGISSGTGELTLRLDSNDTFSVAGSEFISTVGATTIFYDDALHTNELARVTVTA